MKIAKWTGLTLFALFTIAIGYYAYLVMSFDTETLPDKYGAVQTELFMGEGRNQPLLVGLGGAEGGNAWASDYWKPHRDRFMAQGYAFLALGYFGMEGIPAVLDRIAVEGVHRAIREAAANPAINGECIALIGGSKGAELALVLASHFPDIKAVVAMVPGHAVFPAHTIAMNTSSFALNGEPLAFIPVPWSATPALLRHDLRTAFEKMLEDDDAAERAAIRVEAINGPVFLLSATRDEFWPSREMSELIVQRMGAHGFPHHVEHVAITGSHAAILEHLELVEGFLHSHFMHENAGDCPRALRDSWAVGDPGHAQESGLEF